ncbi:MAG: NAD-dependent malic enzyme, partial [Eubacteriales bacterium]
MNYNEMSLELCARHQGKLEVVSKVPITTREELSTAYTPGVAEPCRKIHADKHEAYKYTIKGRT